MPSIGAAVVGPRVPAIFVSPNHLIQHEDGGVGEKGAQPVQLPKHLTCTWGCRTLHALPYRASEETRG